MLAKLAVTSMEKNRITGGCYCGEVRFRSSNYVYTAFCNLFLGFQSDSLKFEKRCHFFVGPDDESFSVAVMCVSKKDRSPARVHGCDTAPNSNRTH